MPRFDGTGPQGNGPMTGRRMGRCFDNGFEENDRQYFNNNAQQCSRGFGCRMGFGRGQGKGQGFGNGRRCRGQ